MPEPILNPDLDEPISTGGGSKKGKGGGGGDYSLSTTLHGNARIVGDQRVQGNNHIDKSCVVRQNIYCAKALEASAYTIRASSYGDPEDPQYDPEHKYTTNIVAGFVTNDEDGNLCFGQPGDGSAGGVTALDQLTDVTLTTPADREYLCFDNISSQWINAAIPFDDLSDVVITSPVDGQSVVFDGGSSTWINQALNDEFIQLSDTPADYSGSAKKFVRINDTNDGLDFSNIKGSDMSDVELGDLSDVDLKLLNTPSIGDHLEFDGTDWVPGAAAAGASFLGHTDTPSDYTGAGAFFVKVNAGATALEFVATVPIDLDDLTDITLSGVANCDFLQFDTGSGQWENKQDVSFAGTLQFKEAKATGPVTFLDSFGNILLQMAPKNTASVNHLRIFSNATGGNVEVFATGADADVNLRLRAKGPNSKVIISRDVDTSGNICAEGIIDAEGYEVKGVAVTGGFVKNLADGTFTFDNSAGAVELDDLTDVTLSSPGSGEYLCHNGSNWVNAPISLGDLDDVDVSGESGPSNGMFLTFNGGIWSGTNHTPSIEFHSDVAFGSIADNDVIVFDSSLSGGLWTNKPNVLDVLSDVNITAPTNADVLTFNSTSGNWESVAPAGGASELDNLTDVTLSSPTDANVLQFDGSVWVNRSDVELSSTSAYYLGDPTADGTWRFVRNGNNLEVQLQESGNYNSKGSFTP